MTSLLAQAIPVPDVAWSAISPELVLFGTGILVLLLDTAGETKLRSSFLAFGVALVGAILAIVYGGQVVLPVLVVLAGLLQLALTALWRDRPRTLGAILSALGFAGGLGVTAWLWVETASAGVAGAGPPVVATETFLSGMVAQDGVALFSRFTICLAGLITIPLGFAYSEERRIHRGEYYPLLLFAATGMTLLASAGDLIMVFIAVEILSLALYILSGFAKRDLHSQESALKYFLLGSFASALLLYGVALVYGLTGSTNIEAAGAALSSLQTERTVVLIAMAMLLVGLGFKTSLVPFHMWTPDVYQGAPTPVTGFMAAATKAAAFAAVLRIFVGAFGGLQWSWAPALAFLAALTMLVGAVLAVVQRDLKRMLGYSAITHAGYVSIGIVASNGEGVSATLLYLLVYALMSLGSFGVLTLWERRAHKAVSLDDLRGMWRHQPLPAAMLALFLLSLAGIPGTAGFVAKLAVFRAGIDEGWVALVLVGVVSTVVAAFFYIRVIVAMFMDEARDAVGAVGSERLPAELPAVPPVGLTVGLALAAAAIVAFGILPGALVDLASQAASLIG